MLKSLFGLILLTFFFDLPTLQHRTRGVVAVEKSQLINPSRTNSHPRRPTVFFRPK